MGPSALEVQSGGGRGRWVGVEPIDPELLNRALAALGERFSMGVILFDGRLDLIWASGATSGVVGWDVSEILGRNVLDLVHPDDIERVMPMLEVALDDPLARLNRSSSVRTAELSVRVTDPGGGWRTVLVAGRVIDLDGNLVVTVRPAEERVAFDRVLQLLGRGERLSMTLDGCSTSCGRTSSSRRASSTPWTGRPSWRGIRRRWCSTMAA